MTRDPLAEVVILAGLVHSDAPAETRWGLDQWRQFGRCLQERELLVFVWRTLYNLTNHRIGELLGCSHTRSHQLYNRACTKLARSMASEVSP